MKCSIINGSTISFDHLATPLQLLFSIGLQSGDLARSPGLIQRILQRACAGACANLGQRRIQTLINSMLIGDPKPESGPITY